MKTTSSTIKKMFWLLLLFTTITACEEETVDVAAKSIVTGKVVQDQTFLPLENVKISTNPNTSTVFTDVNGEFRIEIPVGKYAVQAVKEGFLAAFESATVESGATVNIVFELKTETANNKPPLAPTLVFPVDNAVDVNSPVELDWETTDPDDDTITYTVELRNTNANTIQTFTNLTESKLSTPLNFGVNYTWQVRASDGINPEVNSIVRSFKSGSFPNNRFLFVKKENNNNVIFSGDGNGNSVALTTSATNSWRPRLNRTANKIAFFRSVGTTVHVFTMNLDGSNANQVTNTVAPNGFNLDELELSWSSNGSQIYFASQNKLYRINIDGTGLSLVYQAASGLLVSEYDVNNDLIAIKVNDLAGYNVSILIINTSGNLVTTVLTGMPGAAGGINLNANNSKVLYTRDVSGFENVAYRQLDSRVFEYVISSSTTSEISLNKELGTNDLDVRYSPTESSLVVRNQANDGNSAPRIQTFDIIATTETRLTKYTNATMPDWE